MKCKVKKKINLIQSSKGTSVDKGMTISRKSNTSFYDTFIEETGKLIKMIERNHKRLFSEDHSNMWNKPVIIKDEINKEFSNNFNIKDINSTTMSNLMKSIENEHRKKIGKYKTIIAKIEKGNHCRKSSQSSITSNKSKKMMPLKRNKSSSKLVSMKSTKQNSVKTSKSKLMEVNYSQKNLIIKNNNNNIFNNDSLLEATDERPNRINLKKNAYTINLLSDIIHNNDDNNDLLLSQNDEYLKGLTRNFKITSFNQTNNYSTGTNVKNNINILSYEKTEENIEKNNGCGIIRNAFCCK